MTAPNPASPQRVIRIRCPKLSCQRVLAVPEHARGKLVRCRGCGTNIRIPQPKLPGPVVDRADEDKAQERD